MQNICIKYPAAEQASLFKLIGFNGLTLIQNKQKYKAGHRFKDIDEKLLLHRYCKFCNPRWVMYSFFLKWDMQSLRTVRSFNHKNVYN